MSLGFGLGAEVDVIGFLVSRYFGLRAYGEVYGYLFAIFTLGTGFGPVLMAICFDMTRSYDVALIGLAVALVGASILVSRLGSLSVPGTAERNEDCRLTPSSRTHPARHLIPGTPGRPAPASDRTFLRSPPSTQPAYRASA